MENVLKLDQDGEIARITIDRPEKGNMLTLEMLDYVSALIIDAGCDPDIKAISGTHKVPQKIHPKMLWKCAMRLQRPF